MSAIEILFESNQIIVITKPAGTISEHNKFEADNAEALVRTHLSEKVKTPFVGITHRLDRVTSGILLMAKRPGTLKTVNQWFENRQIKKTYLAITSSAPEMASGILEHHLWTDLEQKKAMVVSGKKKGARLAQLSYRTLAVTDFGCLLEIKPKTGRFHQIRAQFAHIGCPIIGDEKYGNAQPYLKQQIALHAYTLELPQAINNSPVQFTAGLPDTGLWSRFADQFK